MDRNIRILAVSVVEVAVFFEFLTSFGTRNIRVIIVFWSNRHATVSISPQERIQGPSLRRRFCSLTNQKMWYYKVSRRLPHSFPMKFFHPKNLFFLSIFGIVSLFAVGCTVGLIQPGNQNTPSIENNSSKNPNAPSVTANKSSFINIPSDLLVTEDGFTPPLSDGFILLTSRLSHNGNTLVFSEISECIRDLNTYSNDSATCTWDYHIITLDTRTQKANIIYSISSSPEQSTLFVPIARAGGCQLIYLPVAWSKDDQTIILKWANPTTCGSESPLEFEFFTIHASGGDIAGLAATGALFFDDFDKVVSTSDNPFSPPTCGPDPNNAGRVSLREVTTGTEMILLDVSGIAYQLVDLNEDNDTIFRYKERSLALRGSCGSVDNAGDEVIKEFNIDEFIERQAFRSSLYFEDVLNVKSWPTYQSPELGIQFSYPPSWGEVSDDIRDTSQEIDPFTDLVGKGKELRIFFSKGSGIDLFVATTSDYSSGHEQFFYQGDERPSSCASDTIQEVGNVMDDVYYCLPNESGISEFSRNVFVGFLVEGDPYNKLHEEIKINLRNSEYSGLLIRNIYEKADSALGWEGHQNKDFYLKYLEMVRDRDTKIPFEVRRGMDVMDQFLDSFRSI